MDRKQPAGGGLQFSISSNNTPLHSTPKPKIFNVFKPKRLRDGKTHVARLYSGRYRLNGSGKVVTVPLQTPDKQVATEKLRKLVNEIQREGEGLTPPKALRDAGQKTLTAHLEEFLSAKGSLHRDARYLYELKNHVLKLLGECRWDFPKDVTAESFIAWRSERTQSDKTLNEYLTSMRTLLNWMEKKGRLARNPLKSVEAPSTCNVATRPRRAFSEEELKRLLAVAGPRRIVYQASALTGLRRSELAQLQRGDLHLDGERPYLVARASTTKNGKQANLPLHSVLAVALRDRLRELPEDGSALVFADLMPTMDEFRADLKAAGVAFLDEKGRRGDFHSLRHTFCTNLQRADVPIREAMELMRHSERRLTDRVYTDSSQLETRGAMERLCGFGTGDAQLHHKKKT